MPKATGSVRTRSSRTRKARTPHGCTPTCTEKRATSRMRATGTAVPQSRWRRSRSKTSGRRSSAPSSRDSALRLAQQRLHHFAIEVRRLDTPALVAQHAVAVDQECRGRWIASAEAVRLQFIHHRAGQVVDAEHARYPRSIRQFVDTERDHFEPL